MVDRQIGVNRGCERENGGSRQPPVVVPLTFSLFLAEDSIRDLIRSRGLGDVYRRQLATGQHLGAGPARPACERRLHDSVSVSYTHLTLPTKRIV